MDTIGTRLGFYDRPNVTFSPHRALHPFSSFSVSSGSGRPVPSPLCVVHMVVHIYYTHPYHPGACLVAAAAISAAKKSEERAPLFSQFGVTKMMTPRHPSGI